MTASDEAKKVLEGVPALLAEIEALRVRAKAAELREKSLLECNEINRKTLTKYNAEHAAKIAAKDAEIARLREALVEIEDASEPDYHVPEFRHVKYIASAALKGDTRE